MIEIKIQHLKLPYNLRYKLKDPIGELIAGTVEETTPILVQKLSNFDFVISVGDIVSKILLDNGMIANIMITDGLTKRAEVEQISSEFYKSIHIQSPAAEVSVEAWVTIRNLVNAQGKFHIIVDGEEDLLVLPIILEFPNGTAIVYGQPNEGAVIAEISSSIKSFAHDLILQMISN
ncbi:MAG: DUF359 domain-containing protein [Candidatus Heimdallarchaeota archaeon]|nr:DUF359 domain-containing protein [Candidatus Heimdallarchaeota archaeon]